MQLSRSVRESLEEYCSLILKWNKKINLISKTTESDIWERHIIDSAQIYNYIENKETDVICDIGSGSGLPGLVLSIMGCNNILIIESDTKKCSFLNFASNLSSGNIIIKNNRIEDFSTTDEIKNIRNFENNLEFNKIDYITSRAFATIDKILSHSIFLKPKKALLLLKGENYQKELEQAKENWHFKCECYNSLTNTRSALIKITNVSKKN